MYEADRKVMESVDKMLGITGSSNNATSETPSSASEKIKITALT
jgi:hypothetical protein